MLKSMTAYGRAEYVKDDLEITAEIRSVNSRFREIITRLPQSLQPFDDILKSMVSSSINRGRAEVSIQIRENGGRFVGLKLNRPLVQEYIKIFNELSEETGSNREVDLSFLAQLKDIILVKQDSLTFDNMLPGLKESTQGALDSLEEMRINEGKTIEKDFLERLNKIIIYINEINQLVNVKNDEYREKLEKKIQDIIGDTKINEDRLMQEIAFIAERSDITEELVRVRSHIDQFRKYMESEEPTGRRLDFLLQEMNREVNTISSKASDSFISQRVVEIKAELEKLKEQTQNIE